MTIGPTTGANKAKSGKPANPSRWKHVSVTGPWSNPKTSCEFAAGDAYCLVQATPAQCAQPAPKIEPCQPGSKQAGIRTRTHKQKRESPSYNRHENTKTNTLVTTRCRQQSIIRSLASQTKNKFGSQRKQQANHWCHWWNGEFRSVTWIPCAEL